MPVVTFDRFLQRAINAASTSLPVQGDAVRDQQILIPLKPEQERLGHWCSLPGAAQTGIQRLVSASRMSNTAAFRRTGPCVGSMTCTNGRAWSEGDPL